MEENKWHFWHIMLYYFKKDKNITEMQKKNCAVYGEGAVTDQMCREFFVKFHGGDFSLDDALWSGRPVEVDSDQIETLIETLINGIPQGERWHFQNIQINNKVTGDNEKCVFYFMEKTK